MILLFSKLSFPDAHNYLQIDSWYVKFPKLLNFEMLLLWFEKKITNKETSKKSETVNLK